MDVVRTNIAKLKGIVEIDSEVGKGTIITLKVPMTLAIIQGLLMKVASEIFAVPLSAVLEIIRVEPQDIYTIQGREVIRLRDVVLPLARMADIIGSTQPATPASFSYVVVVGWAEKRIGLLVDSLQGQKEVVIKALGDYLGGCPGYCRLDHPGRRKRYSSDRCRSVYRIVCAPLWKSCLIHRFGMGQSEENLIKVLIIDDSAFMRKSLTLMLESDREIRVIATARDGNDGIDKISKLKPDIVTLDVEMPGMDGLTALHVIMEQMPLPVLMVSSLTTEGADATMRAFDLGAVDFISKDLASLSTNIKNIKGELIDKIKQIARSRLVQTRFRMRRLVQSSREKTSPWRPALKPVSFEGVVPEVQAVVIGISTGGPEALNKLVPKIPEQFPVGMAIVRHMPPHFTKSLAERLNSISKVRVKEAEQGEIVEPGKVLIAPGGKHMTFENDGAHITTVIADDPVNALYRPSADIMMKSAVAAFRGPLLGVIMTGMGKDGVEGLKEIKSKGGYVIAQDEESCIVYGMPQAALEEGVVDSMVSLENISLAFQRFTKIRVPGYRPMERGDGI